LNERLQEKLNPPLGSKPERKLYGTIFRLGDKVMQTQNNYDKDVYNGDIGFVNSIDVVEQTLVVDFDGRTATYDWSDADQLTLAYVVSIHKAQGSEFPVVVMPIVTQHYTMLQRNLLYTAIIRARKLCVLAGNPRAITWRCGTTRCLNVSPRWSGGWERIRDFPSFVYPLSSCVSLLVTGIMEMDAERGEPFLQVERVMRLQHS
jgi:exodeoxyribonuclease V alpha subunit